MKFEFVERKPYSSDQNVIYLQRDKWDDYGWKTYFNIYYNNNYIGDIRITKIIPKDDGEDDGATITWDELEKDQLVNKLIGDSLPDNYYSLSREDTYNSLYNHISSDNVKSFLSKVRDIAYNPIYIERLKSCGVFGSSLIRGVTIAMLKTALYNASHKYEQNKYSLELIYDEFPYDNKSFVLKMNADSNSLLPTNLHTIIGDNGVGKSRLLRDFTISAIMKGKRSFTSEYLGKGYTCRLEGSNDLGNVIYINLNPFDNISLEFENKFSNNSSYEGTLKNIGITFKDNSNASIDRVFSKTFDDIVKTKEKSKLIYQVCEQFRWDKKIFGILKNISELEVDSNLQNGRDKIRQDVESCSSGQKYLIILILSVVENIVAQSVLIIDEPEDFLHPPYVAALISFLSQLLQKVNGFGLIATHSDVALQEIPQECVHHLLQNNKIETPKIQTYAANVSLINQEIFGVSLRNTGFYVYLENLAEREPEKAKELLNKNILGASGSFYLVLLLKRRDEN